MKKLGFIMALLLSSTAAMADVSIGDTAIYHVTITDLTNPDSEAQEADVSESIADIVDNQIAVKLILSQNKEVLDDTVIQYSSSDFLSSEQLQDLLNDCTAQGGAPELVSVPAGNFETCTITTGNTSNWYGNVKLGLVKQEVRILNADGEIISTKVSVLSKQN